MEDVDAVNEVLDAFFDVSTVAVKTTWLIVYGISLIGECLYEYYLSAQITRFCVLCIETFVYVETYIIRFDYT